MGGRSRVEVWLAACLLAGAWPHQPSHETGCALPGLLPAPAAEAPQVTCGGSGDALTGALPLLFGQGLDPGVAEPTALEHLPGVGPARSAALVEARSRRPLCGPRDLLRVHGIGPRTLEGLRPFLRFGADPRCAPGEPPPLDSATGRESG